MSNTVAHQVENSRYVFAVTNIEARLISQRRVELIASSEAFALAYYHSL